MSRYKCHYCGDEHSPDNVAAVCVVCVKNGDLDRQEQIRRLDKERLDYKIRVGVLEAKLSGLEARGAMKCEKCQIGTYVHSPSEDAPLYEDGKVDGYGDIFAPKLFNFCPWCGTAVKPKP